MKQLWRKHLACANCFIISEFVEIQSVPANNAKYLYHNCKN